MLTQARVKELFECREDGNLYRKVLNKKTKSGAIGTNNGVGYKVVKVDGVKHYVHRVVFLWHHGYLPEYIDHIDTNKSNNSIENLRKTTNSQNGANRGIQSNNKTGFKGVFFDKDTKKYRARITVNYKMKYLGVFNDAHSASIAYNSAAEQYFGNFARIGL